RITSWDTEIEGAPLLWTERDTILPDELTIRFESIDGDFDVFRGAWLVVPHGAGVVLACELEYSLGVAILDELVGPILKQKIVENLSIMLDGLTRGLGGG
ncbi:MAG: hypothetical protein FJ125_01600, partial [Deltaproteobacteria bacterium]|nr:hypothetical protein [Deltaproteobacteria bacterium]